MSVQSANLLFFERTENGSFMNSRTLINPAGTGHCETYSFIYSHNQLKEELMV